MTYFNRLNKAINFIEENLKEPLALEQIAKHAGFSLYHFHRIFHSLVGDSLKEYIRKRRLSCAAHELNYSARNITDIAFDYQYSTPESFSRAFKKLFAVNPSKFIKEKMELNLYEKVNLDKNVCNLLKGFDNLTPEIITKHAFQVMGETKTMSLKNEDNIQQEIEFADDFLQRGRWKAIPQRKRPGKALAIGFDLDSVNMCYTQILGAEVELGTSLADGFIVRRIPATKYALFRVHGLRPIIQTAWDTILSNWIIDSQFEHDQSGFHFQIYDENWLGLEPGDVEIYIPLK